MATTRPDTIRLPNDPELYRLLDQLRVKATEAPDHLGKVITEGACRKAGVPFQVFEAFARLTGGEPPVGSRLWTEKKKAVKVVVGGIDLVQSRRAVLESFLKELTPSDRETLIRGISRMEAEAAASQFSDEEIDHQESDQLRRLLKSLDGASPPVQQDRLVSPRQVKVRLAAVASDSCWLVPESIETGLLGAVTGDLKYLHDVVRGWTTPATEFSCHYLPQLKGLQGGLFFRPEAMPPPIQVAAQSVLQIEIETPEALVGLGGIVGGTERGWTHVGSGVVIDKQYVLTARHLVEGDFFVRRGKTGGRQYYSLRITLNGRPHEVPAEPVEIPGNGKNSFPDLLLFHIPTLPSGARPLPFADDFHPLVTEQRREAAPEVPSFSQGHFNLFKSASALEERPTITRTYRTYPSRRVFAIGVTGFQEPPIDLLVTEGVVDHRHTSGPIGKRDGQLTYADDNGGVRTASIVLPGDSGGAVVDDRGRLIGIIVAFYRQPDEERSRWDGLEEIDNSLMHPIDQWGSAIRAAIQTHRSRLRPK